MINLFNPVNFLNSFCQRDHEVAPIVPEENVDVAEHLHLFNSTDNEVI